MAYSGHGNGRGFLQWREWIIPISPPECCCKRDCLLNFAPCPPPGYPCNNFTSLCQAQNLTRNETDIVMAKCGYDCQSEIGDTTTTPQQSTTVSDTTTPQQTATVMSTTVSTETTFTQTTAASPTTLPTVATTFADETKVASASSFSLWPVVFIIAVLICIVIIVVVIWYRRKRCKKHAMERQLSQNSALPLAENDELDAKSKKLSPNTHRIQTFERYSKSKESVRYIDQVDGPNQTISNKSVACNEVLIQETSLENYGYESSNEDNYITKMTADESIFFKTERYKLGPEQTSWSENVSPDLSYDQENHSETDTEHLESNENIWLDDSDFTLKDEVDESNSKSDMLMTSQNNQKATSENKAVTTDGSVNLCGESNHESADHNYSNLTAVDGVNETDMDKQGLSDATGGNILHLDEIIKSVRVDNWEQNGPCVSDDETNNFEKRYVQIDSPISTQSSKTDEGFYSDANGESNDKSIPQSDDNELTVGGTER